MYRLYIAIRLLNKIYNRKDFDLLGSKFEMFDKTWLYTDFKLICDKGELPHYHFRKERIDDLMLCAIRLKFIEPRGGLGRNRYAVTPEGRNFLKPIYFIEYSAREFGYTASILSAFLVGATLAYLAYIFSQDIS